MSTIRAREPGWADVLEDHAAEWATARRLVGQLGACEAKGCVAHLLFGERSALRQERNGHVALASVAAGHE